MLNLSRPGRASKLHNNHFRRLPCVVFRRYSSSPPSPWASLRWRPPRTAISTRSTEPPRSMPGQTAGDVSTVNGAVRIGAGATVEEAARSTARSNSATGPGPARWTPSTAPSAWAADSQVTGEVSAVNGSIQPGRRCRRRRQAGQRQRHHQARRRPRGRRHRDGGRRHHRRRQLACRGRHSGRQGARLVPLAATATPTIVIGPHAVVPGTLEFRREVVLKVSDSAQIGPVKGATRGEVQRRDAVTTSGGERFSPPPPSTASRAA